MIDSPVSRSNMIDIGTLLIKNDKTSVSKRRRFATTLPSILYIAHQNMVLGVFYVFFHSCIYLFYSLCFNLRNFLYLFGYVSLTAFKYRNAFHKVGKSKSHIILIYLNLTKHNRLKGTQIIRYDMYRKC